VSDTPSTSADPQAILRAAEAAARRKAAARATATGAAATQQAATGLVTQRAGGAREGAVATLGSDVDGDVRNAVAFILRSTGAKPQTEAELRRKLAGRDVDEDAIDAALVHARALRAVDDEAFARSWVAERGRDKHFGAARLRTELRRRLVPEPLIDDALAQLEERDDHAAATELAQRRLRQLPATLAPEAVVRRLTAYLVRRGHPPALAQRVAIAVSGIDRDWD
jgi:regulatory protein